MFTSSKIIDSPRINSSTIHSGLSDTANGIPRSFIQPKITSTPLVRRESIFATPPKPRILGPRRYSLSDIATPPRSSRRDPTKIHTAGPLLASTRYNVNVSTYEDTKSPGLAGRIVQYNEEAERERERQRPPTHQAKYGSPGLFPVVHLFKKKLPTLDQKPRRVTIRIASPEYSRQHSQEYNRKLLEGIVKPGSPTNSRRLFTLPSGEGSSSTRSVLDALKEISRKRIHANEVKTVLKRLCDEYEQNEEGGKRLRTEQFNGVDSAKRVRDESPLLDTSSSPTKPISKRVCMYDEYAASCSSMDFSFKKSDQSGPKRKSISISTLTENPKDSKQVKLINAETQTVTSENKRSTDSNEYVAEEHDQTANQKDDGDDKTLDMEESPPKVFDDAPLERIRKNRLAALMGSLTGKDAFIAPKPNFSTSLSSSSDTSKIPEITISEVYKAPDKPLISILSTPKKASPNKSNKHVHFSIPESTSQTNITSTPITSFSVTQSSTSIITPISSVSESKISFGSSKSEERLETPAPPSSPVSLTPSSTSVTTAVPVIMFGTGSNSSSLASIVSKESSSLAIESSKSDLAVPNFQFKSTAPSSGLVGTTSSITFSSGPSSITTFGSSVAKPSSNMASPPKLGGFKFDLSKSASTANTTATSNVPTFSFGNTSQTEINKSKSILGSTTDPKSSQPNLALTPVNFSFGPKSTSAVSSASNTSITSFSTGGAFGTNTTTSSPGTQVTTVVPSFKFGSNNASSNSAALGGFGVATTSSPFGTPSTTSSTPSFGTNTSTPTYGTNTSTPAFGTNTSTPAFGPNTSTPTFGPNTSTPTFGTNPSTAPPATSVSPFGTSKPPAYPFGSSNAPSGFGAPATTSASITFGAPSTTTAPAPAGFAVSATSPSSGFGSTPTSVPSIGFGSTTVPSSLGGFGAPSTSANTGFGTSTVPMFGANKAASPFGASTSATPTFGTPSVSNASPFGKSSASPFGQSMTQSGFGAPTTTATTDSFGTTGTFIGTTTTSSSMFGGSGSATPSFGVKTGGFGGTSTNTNIFGAVTNAQVSGFGSTTSKPAFGVATTSPFGNPTATTTTPSFGNNASTFSFGAKTTASSSFGGSGNAFGTTTTTSSTGFGTSTTPTFNASNSFGSTSGFGSGNAFGSTGTPAFGAATTTTTTTQPGGFGTTNTSTFGATNAGFNAPNKSAGFGNSTAPAFGATAAPAFGATAPATGFGSSNMSGFGTNSAASAFSKPQTAQNAFGSTSNAFGTNNNFAAAQPQSSGFGATNTPTTQSGVFSFGSGAPQKPAGIFSFGAASSSEAPKPSFNFSGGSTAAPAFGNSGTPAFGSAGTSSFGANAPPLQFNAPQPAAPGMFSIGSGSSSGKSRTHLKAKRRT